MGFLPYIVMSVPDSVSRRKIVELKGRGRAVFPAKQRNPCGWMDGDDLEVEVITDEVFKVTNLSLKKRKQSG
jgi:bifunctional DNA-binding transcriptional regulator/antitoxin component of YhaV-PrlF toxin-antitoxin module